MLNQDKKGLRHGCTGCVVLQTTWILFFLVILHAQPPEHVNQEIPWPQLPDILGLGSLGLFPHVPFK